MNTASGIRTSSTFPFVWDDGGRAATGRRGDARDCVARAISIAVGIGYSAAYDALSAGQSTLGKPRSARDGIQPKVYRSFLTAMGWYWVHTMTIGSGTLVHLRPGELPPVDRLIARVSKHLTAVIDGVIRDTHDPSRDGTRAVYGVWTPEPWTWRMDPPGSGRIVWERP